MAWAFGKDDAAAWKHAESLLEEIRRIFLLVGLSIHKEEVGFRLEMVGLDCGRWDDQEYRVYAKLPGLAALVAATLQLLAEDALGGSDPHTIEQALGHWAFRCLPNRAGFSVFDSVYLWVQRFRGKARAPLWQVARSDSEPSRPWRRRCSWSRAWSVLARSSA